MKYYLAIDLGATSGRHVIGFEEGGTIKLREVHRFETGMDDSPNGLVWDVPRLLREIKSGIKKAFVAYPRIESLSIDTWGVDYVLMDGDSEMPPFYSYRNERNAKYAEIASKTLPFSELYRKTGIQFASFNTIYQLYADLAEGRLERASDYLMLPSYFAYRLTGVKTHEMTDESTGALLDPKTGEYAFSALGRLGLPRRLFGPLLRPGDYVGELLPEIQEEVGGNCQVVLCPTHDTASAFEAIEVPTDAIILSSGTWSLLGIKAKGPIISDAAMEANFTNEMGVGYVRFLKNIMGMYVANRLREETKHSIEEVNALLPKSEYQETFDINSPALSAPKSMKEALLSLLKGNPPKDDIDLFASVYRSMAMGYAKAVDGLERITGETYAHIYVIGGGARSTYLNSLIEECTKKKVIAMPIEATALGNIKTQMKARKEP